MTRIRCDHCEALVINDVPCHETGCPDSHIDLATGELYPVACDWCGNEFVPGEKGEHFCDVECRDAYCG